jgi:hypothetical protein
LNLSSPDATKRAHGALSRLVRHLGRDFIMFGSIARAGVLALFATAAMSGIASARTAYDGAWSLSITTTRGECSTYNFPVQITNGRVSFPGLVRANGRVTGKGAVRVTVAAGDKYASGSGRLRASYGGGRWIGRSGSDRCSGTWSAQRG